MTIKICKQRKASEIYGSCVQTEKLRTSKNNRYLRTRDEKITEFFDANMHYNNVHHFEDSDVDVATNTKGMR